MSFFTGFRRIYLKTIGSSSVILLSTTSFVQASTNNTNAIDGFDAPIYSLKDVGKHNVNSNRMWVSFGDGVYDITDFNTHIGGRKYIELIAGGRLEPFWSIFSDHLFSKYTLKQLEKYRIGNLIESDQIDTNQIINDIKDHKHNKNEFNTFSNEPFNERPMDKLIIMKQFPFLAEPKNELLGESFYTPNELFYTRNHFPVPFELNEENYRLDLHLNIGSDINFTEMNDKWYDIKCDKSLSLNDIKTKYENIEIISTLQCCGNRGYSFKKYDQNIGYNCCLNGFISNAKFKGVRIRDILLNNGYNYDPDDPIYNKYKYITFYGYDTDLSTLHYSMSIPIEYIMNISNDCLLVYEMNNKKLPKDHGYPLRVLLPGIAGCRSVKWLAKIQLTTDEVNCEWNNRFYKPYKYKIYDMPVTSVITKYDYNVNNKYLKVKGFAYSGGGRGIIKVEISLDNGKTWKLCNLEQIKQERGKQWAWTLWNIKFDLNDIDINNNRKILCRAMDTSFNSQPRHPTDVLNGTMYMNNSWHSVDIKL